jgi:tRNA G18 (ribose-2'-O)-methylase SpoU
MKHKKGFTGIGIYHTKIEFNIGTLWRSGYQLGADFIFTIGRRYKTQGSDTVKAPNSIPLFHYQDYDDFMKHLPLNTSLVAIEMGGQPLNTFVHPNQAVYLLGAEDHGLPPSITSRVKRLVSIPAIRTDSYNVAVAGSLVLYDRMIKLQS